MGLVSSVINATGNAIISFGEWMLNADPSGRYGPSFGRDRWCGWQDRQFRYDLYWALYQNNAYRDKVHQWATRYKAAYGAYKHVRHLYNPAYRLGEFWQGHLWGGPLDRDAGDGKEIPSALPIITDIEDLRPAIAKIRRDSNWQINKDVFTLWGSVLGDAAIKGVDDPRKGQVRKELVHPGHLAYVEFDDQRNVKGYEIRKWVDDPRDKALDQSGRRKSALYTERCSRDGEKVVYQTFIDEGKPYAWNGGDAEWSEDYGFVPMVVVNHRSIGLDWGENCFHGGLSRFLEVDNQASILGDQNAKSLMSPTLITGAKGPQELMYAGKDRSRMTPQQIAANPEPSRTEKPFLYLANDLARPHSLVTPMDLPGMIRHIEGLLADIERNYPELVADTGTLGGAVTATEMKLLQGRASAKVQGARPAYDDADRRMDQMLIAIGGYRGYDGFRGFGLDSFEAGGLDFSIAHRPVFDLDPMDKLAEESAFLANVAAAGKAGIPARLYLEQQGWSDEDLKALDEAKAAEPPPSAAAVMPGQKTPAGVAT